MYFEFQNGAGTYLSGVTGDTFSVAGRHGLSFATAVALSSRIRSYINVTEWHAGDSIDIVFDELQIEKSSILTPYFSGDSPDCSWSGAANASTSVRAASVLVYPSLNSLGFGSALTLAMSATPLTGPSVYVGYLDSSATGYSDWDFLLHHSQTYGGPHLAINRIAANQILAKPTTSVPGTAWSWVGRVVGGSMMDLMVDGSAAAQAATAITPTFANPTRVGLGASAYIGPVALCPSRITDLETAQLDAMLTAGARGIDLFKWFKDKHYDGTLILPLEGDSRGYIVGGGGVGDNYSYTEVAATTDQGYEVYS
jgi:hypothetical protein